MLPEGARVRLQRLTAGKSALLREGVYLAKRRNAQKKQRRHFFRKIKSIAAAVFLLAQFVLTVLEIFKLLIELLG